MNDNKPLPPGLREFADAYQLSDNMVAELANTWDTIRGRRPQTAEEWARIWEFIRQLMDDDSELMREVMKDE